MCSFGEILGSNCGPIIPPGKDTFVDEIISLEYCKNCQYKRLTADYGLRTTDYGLRTTDYGLRTTDYGLRTTDYGLGIKHGLRYKTRTKHYGLGIQYGLGIKHRLGYEQAHTGTEFEKAIFSRGGIKGLRVTLADTTIFNSFNAPKLTGISQLNNFTFSEEGVVARRAYEIGEGKFLPWSSTAILSPFL